MTRRYQLIAGATALAAALMVSAAPPVRGDPAPLAKAEAEIAASSQARAAVRPNPDEQVPTARPARVGAPVAPTPAVQPNADEQTPVAAAQGAGPRAEVIGRGGRGFSDTPATIVRVTSPGGFDWGDAGIGAAGALGLATLTAAGALAIAQRRSRRTTRSPSAIS